MAHLAFFHPFFFNDTATTEIYTLSLHDALPISRCCTRRARSRSAMRSYGMFPCRALDSRLSLRSEEHTSELQSQSNLVCRLLLEKKKIENNNTLLSRILRCYIVTDPTPTTHRIS